MLIILRERILLAWKRLPIKTLGDDEVWSEKDNKKVVNNFSLDNGTESKKNEIIFGMITYSLNAYHYTLAFKPKQKIFYFILLRKISCLSCYSYIIKWHIYHWVIEIFWIFWILRENSGGDRRNLMRRDKGIKEIMFWCWSLLVCLSSSFFFPHSFSLLF